LRSVYDTWWGIVNKTIHAFLCVNNSYSGSRVTGQGFPAAASMERVTNLHTGDYSPDLVLVYIGFNDFGKGLRVNKKGMSVLSHKEASFSEAYRQMIISIKKNYPRAKIICGTLMRTKIKAHENWIFPETYAGVPFEDYNVAIRKVCKKQNCYLVDLAALGTSYESLDGSHPTAEGHATIAWAWLQCLQKLDVLDASVETCIKMYHANKNSDSAVYMVFSSLAHEKVLMPFNSSGQLVGLSLGNQDVIPIFTSPNKVGKENGILLRPVFLRDQMELLIKSGKDVIVNPFSDANIQFFIPHVEIEKIRKMSLIEK
ncbi:MAG: SGNH/GDSL hydrolase family protein, partial [Lachnospiraceae bacterium]|nr:SGNH/GDSL hydrolase family protein [Lachnospiraceae bacterium]